MNRTLIICTIIISAALIISSYLNVNRYSRYEIFAAYNNDMITIIDKQNKTLKSIRIIGTDQTLVWHYDLSDVFVE